MSIVPRFFSKFIAYKQHVYHTNQRFHCGNVVCWTEDGKKERERERKGKQIQLEKPTKRITVSVSLIPVFILFQPKEVDEKSKWSWIEKGDLIEKANEESTYIAKRQQTVLGDLQWKH